MMLKKVKFISFVLSILLIVSSVPFGSAVAKEQQLPETATAETVQPEAIQPETDDSLIAVSDILADDTAAIKQYISAEKLEAHAYRMTAEETLDTFVFKNQDNTRTVYFMEENVKFTDTDGKVKEKDITLVQKDKGFTVKSNDIGVNIPLSIKDGVTVNYFGYDIKVVPNVEKDAVGRKQNNSVIYKDVFGSKTILMYTPLLSGVKEDVVLTSYVPNASFSFVLYTDGLNVYQNESGYYLADKQKQELLFNLGSVIMYDANGVPALGTMEVTQVAEGEKYIITVIPDEAFLADENTAYPVTVFRR